MFATIFLFSNEIIYCRSSYICIGVGGCSLLLFFIVVVLVVNSSTVDVVVCLHSTSSLYWFLLLFLCVGISVQRHKVLTVSRGVAL